MNTFIEEKLGEVLAFARVGKDTVVKGQKSLAKLVEERHLEGLDEKFDSLEESVIAFSTTNDVLEKVEEQAKESEDKITKMRDLYIGGKWDEDSEVLEWMGFYTGASLVHWYLLSGADEDLEALSKEPIAFYTSLFSSDEQVLKMIGRKQGKK